MLPVVVPIDDLPPLPDEGLTAGLLQLQAGVVAEHAHLGPAPAVGRLPCAAPR